jgi:hypothetical protein
MADSSFRTFRRDAPARGTEVSEHDGMSDPLAELARLIGQSEAHGRNRDAGQSAEAFEDAAPASELDWVAADEGYAQRGSEAEQGYASPRVADSYQPRPPEGETWPPGPAYEDTSADRQYLPPAVPSDDVRGDPRGNGRMDAAYDRGASQPAASGLPPPLYIPPAQGGYHADEQRPFPAAARTDAGDSVHDEYEEEGAPSRPRAAIVVVIVLGLAVLGTAGALGYRAMFGGSVIPSLPPIIAPGNKPIKIVPKHDSQAGTPSQADAGSKGTTEQLVPHEEQPVDVQSANPVPRVVTTIPVSPNPPDASSLGGEPPAAPVPASASPNGPPQPVGATDQLTSPAPPPSGSKPVHTVIIRADQPPAAKPVVPPPAPAARPARVRQIATEPAREAAPRTASAGPLSIVPTEEGQPAPRTRAAPAPRSPAPRSSAPMALAAAPADTAPADAAPSGGGYAVQVSSQRSEAEAQAAFRSLQAKYPQQLSGRHAIVRRADLGAKGVYDRALVGPFASGEQASSLCSSLKAAGGNCVIQRN